MYTLRFDGLFRGIPTNRKEVKNAGFMSYGWLVFHGEIVIATGHGVFGRGVDATSNAAEYLALIEGLEALRDLGIRYEPVKVQGDAKSVIDQMRGASAVNSGRVKPLYRRASKAANWFGSLLWEWIPRRKNRVADWLSRRAMKQMRLDANGYSQAVKTIDPANRSHQGKKLQPFIDLRIYQPASQAVITSSKESPLPRVFNAREI
jgi:ribonuclease HI